MTRLDVQREALRQLMTLSGECARVNQQMEEQRAEKARKAAQDFARATGILAEQYTEKRARLKATFQEQIEQIRQRYADQKQQSDQEIEAVRADLNDKHRRLTKKLKKQHQDACWLIDTVLESESARLQEADARARTLVKENADALTDLQEQAREVARRYSHTLPEVDAPAPAGAEGVTDTDQLSAALEAQRGQVEARLQSLRRLFLPRLVVGVTPWAIGLLIVLLAGLVAHVLTVGEGADVQQITTTAPDWPIVGGTAGGLALLLVGLGVWLRMRANARVRDEAGAFAESLAVAQASAKAQLAALMRNFDEELLAANAVHERETGVANARHERQMASANDQYQAAAAKIEAQAQARSQQHRGERDSAIAEVEGQRDRERHELEQWRSEQTAVLAGRRDKRLAEAQQEYDAGRDRLIQRWEEALQITRDLSEESDRPEFAAIADWSRWQPPATFAPTVRFGELQVDVARFVDQAALDGDSDGSSDGSNGSTEGAKALRLPIPMPYEVPALLAFPDHANLLIKHDPAGRDAAVASLRLTMIRLLTSLPPGRVQFTLIDPVGLGRSFAGFMHLVDYDEALVGGRVWTETDAIEQKLGDLTEHMETVIQKYLRNEFETIDDYNAQAGELAEPYRFLVIADLPTGFSEKALSRLASIAASGARCGVHVLAALDTRQTMRGAATFLEDLERHCSTLLHEKAEGADRFRWQEPTFGQLPLTLDEPPDEAALTDVLRAVGRAAREAKRVEVPFDTIAPKPDQFWSLDSAHDLHVPVGRTGATRLQQFRLGRGVAQHALVAGKTGSGKSTLLNGLITNLSMWYAPDQLELYLIDFKRGVEFKAYATHALPHARAVAVESDREFGLSVLQRLDTELGRRGELFRSAGVQDLAAFRKARPGETMPRVLLIVDEFQELFAEDDKLSQDAALYIDRLVRQGRAFGIHVILGSQTIGGTAGLPRSTLGQMAVRVALQCSEADSQLILGDNNAAARLLTRPGEAIYNDAGGAVEANSPFQVAWLPDDQREAFLRRVREKARAQSIQIPPQVVFEGNAPARVEENDELADALAGRPPRPLVAYLGEPVAIREPTHIAFRRQTGASLLVVGQQEEPTTALMAMTLISLCATNPADRPMPAFRIFDGTPADAPMAGVLRRVTETLPAQAEVIDYRAVPDAMVDLADELQGRLDGSRPDVQPIFLVVHGLQRYRALRRGDDFGPSASLPSPSSGFGSILGEESEEPAPAPATPPDKVLADLLRDGPPVGIHVIASIDTLVSIERTFSRDSVREFDARVLFQMSANDSSVLIDSPAANRLGFHRALAWSEEQGTHAKFRPYALPSDNFLAHVKEALAGR